MEKTPYSVLENGHIPNRVRAACVDKLQKNQYEVHLFLYSLYGIL